MVDELRLWAISANEVRQFFAAPPELAHELRQITDSLAPDSPAQTRLFSKFGPLLRRPPQAPVIRDGVPNRGDGEAMMAGQYVSSERLVASWDLVRAWLDARSKAHTIIPLPREKMDQLEFDLVRTGVPTQISIRRLWGRGLEIPLRATDGMSVGYMTSETVGYLAEQWTGALDELEEDTAAFARPLVEFASAFPQYATEDPPDLVAWWTSRR